MAFKARYLFIAAIGLAVAGTAAWRLQRGALSTAPGGVQTQGASKPGPGKEGAQKPVSVEVARVRTMALHDEAQAVGSLRSRRSVVLRPEVSGRVTQLQFSDGARVRKGQLLVQFDDQLPRAQVQQARAELSIAQANHRSTKAPPICRWHRPSWPWPKLRQRACASWRRLTALPGFAM